jgi:PBP1b-binding outer membrane lipoprotein LpoB
MKYSIILLVAFLLVGCVSDKKTYSCPDKYPFWNTTEELTPQEAEKRGCEKI